MEVWGLECVSSQQCFAPGVIAFCDRKYGIASSITGWRVHIKLLSLIRSGGAGWGVPAHSLHVVDAGAAVAPLSRLHLLLLLEQVGQEPATRARARTAAGEGAARTRGLLHLSAHFHSSSPSYPGGGRGS